MAKTRRQKLRELVERDHVDVAEFSEFISENINDTELLTQVLMKTENETSGFGDRLADKVAEFGGSWAFIITFFWVLAVWIFINVWIFTQKPFDPYPFILLNLVLSCIAAIQAPVIMMSQNRKEDKDRKRAQNDYLINLKAELEIKNLQTNMKNLFELQKKQLEMLEAITEKMKK